MEVGIQGGVAEHDPLIVQMHQKEMGLLDHSIAAFVGDCQGIPVAPA